MKLNYFNFWDYRALKTYTWEQCGYNYNIGIVRDAIEHPEWFTVSNPAPRLTFPPKPHEVGIFPYTEEEIKYLEAELNFYFPESFKELLFLYGGLIFDPHQGQVRGKYDSENGYQKLSINNDLTFIKQSHQDFIDEFVRFNNKRPQEHFYTVNKIETQIGYFYILISNQQKDSPIYEFASQYYGKEIIKISESTTEAIFKGVTVIGSSFRDEVDRLFFTGYSSKHSAKLFEKELKKQDELKKLEIKIINSIIWIKNHHREVISIIIEYDNMPRYHYNHIFSNDNRDYTMKMVFSYHFTEIVNSKKVLCKGLISKFKEINFI